VWTPDDLDGGKYISAILVSEAQGSCIVEQAGSLWRGPTLSNHKIVLDHMEATEGSAEIYEWNQHTEQWLKLVVGTTLKGMGGG